jgi:hypothetical protein
MWKNHEGKLILQDADDLMAVWMLANRTIVSKTSDEQLKESAERLAIAAGERAMKSFNDPSMEVSVHLGLEDAKLATDAARDFMAKSSGKSDDSRIFQKIARIAQFGTSQDQ